MTEIRCFVHGIERIDDGALIGVRNNDVDVRVGDVFTSLLGPAWQKDAASKTLSLVPVDPGPPRTIALRVETIEWYQRVIDFLPAGHTARIKVTGVGSDLLFDGAQIVGIVTRA